MKNITAISKKNLILFFITVTLFATYIFWADTALTVREFQITDKNIPSSFDGFHIAHISDLHNTSFGKENEKLFEKLEHLNPDIIAVTGDVIDSRRTNVKIAADFFEKALEIAPVYYVTGNHELRTDAYQELEACIKKLGVIIAENNSFPLVRDEDKINLCGIADPSAAAKHDSELEIGVVSHYLTGLRNDNTFNLLLSHRPEFFDIYVEGKFDLVLSGHAHGGQFRLPFIGGLIAPGQGLFPEFDSGIYEKENTRMIVSRGLGNSIVPLRLFNRPEIISIILKSN